MTRKAKTPTVDLDDVRDRLNDVGTQLDSVYVDRTDVIGAMLVTACAGEHLLMLSDPGTGKTALNSSFAKHFANAEYWKRQLGAFTTPEAIVGALDIKAFEQGEYKHKVDGMLPTADIGMVDEVLKGAQVVNEMLGILGPEREYAGTKIPLVFSAAATNWPEVERMDAIADALFDRYLIRIPIERIRDRAKLVAVMKASNAVTNYAPRSMVGIDELRAVVEHVTADGNIAVSDAIYFLAADLVIGLAPTDEAEGVDVSERRIARLIKIAKAAAFLAGRDEVTVEDFGILRFGLWTKRGDIERANAAVDAIDAKAVAELVDLIDTGRTAYAECKAGGYGNARINRALATVRTVGQTVKTKFAEPVFTESGRAKVRRAMDALKAEFGDLKARAQG